MTIIRQLKSWFNKQNIYPQTVEQAIYDKEGRRLDNKLSNGVANPNLLINTDFRNPINQREFVSGSAISETNGSFVLDRWYTIGKQTTVDITNSVKLNVKANNFGQILQKVENPQTYTGSKMTFSYKYKVTSGGQGFSMIYFGSNVETITKPFVCDGEWHTDSVTFTVPLNATALWVEMNAINNEYINDKTTTNIPTDESIEVKELKLEEGEISTPFRPRLYAEEFQLCRRYFQKHQAYPLAVMWNSSNAYKSFYVGGGLPNVMRVNPALTFTRGLSYTSQGEASLATLVGPIALGRDYVIFHLDMSSAISVGAGVQCNFTLDAEL